MQIIRNSEVTKGFTGTILFPSLFPAIQFPLVEANFFINSMCICKMYSLLLAIYAFMDIYVYDVKPPIILFHMSKLSNFTYIISFNAHMNSENIMKQNFIGQKSSNTSKSYGWT